MWDTKTKTKKLEFSVYLFLEEFWSNPGQISQHEKKLEMKEKIKCCVIVGGYKVMWRL